ncbi:hypothetical protein E2C01_070091 [Portunus trituberculatus]|uniref:Uncharacterized protein n=1 Tax=Portunus trituberculatus TaxID=210409 RepID=A0A5B7I477_PORTR|nr:hypothetical protein [Portunus trituberculatus]
MPSRAASSWGTPSQAGERKRHHERRSVSVSFYEKFVYRNIHMSASLPRRPPAARTLHTLHPRPLYSRIEQFLCHYKRPHLLSSRFAPTDPTLIPGIWMARDKCGVRGKCEVRSYRFKFGFQYFSSIPRSLCCCAVVSFPFRLLSCICYFNCGLLCSVQKR